MTIKSSLARHQVSTADTFKLKQKAWHEHRILVIHPDHKALDWEQRQAIIEIGNMVYGKGSYAK